MPPNQSSQSLYDDCVVPVHNTHTSYQSLDEQTRLLDSNRNVSNKESPSSEDEGNSRKTFFTGILLSILSGCLFITNNFIIKEYKVVACDAIIVRGVFQVNVLSIFSYIKSYTMFPDGKRKLGLVLTQGMFGGFSFIGALMCVTYMPVADALVVMFSDPLVTMIVASIFLGEKLNILRVMTGFSILAGVTLVCRPPFIFGSELENPSEDDQEIVFKQMANISNATWTGTLYKSKHDTEYWTGAAFAVAAVLTGTFHNIVVPLCREIESIVLVSWVGLAAIFISAVGAQFTPGAMIATGQITEVSLEMWLVFVGLAISGMVAYIFLTKALQMISPTLVSSLRSLEIIFAYVVESILYATCPSLMSITGGLLVVIGVVGIASEKQIISWTSRLFRRQQYQEI